MKAMTEIETDDLSEDESNEDDDESLWETAICWKCHGDGCTWCDFDGWYYPAWTEPNGIN
ncbi:hypothetical protein QUB60_29575 [Microcoleus sp. A2-C5]|uniref:hypothetical protein n=1 Tax=unclassified Microcoleus TaxID=2642155 RepID=UPI002FCE6B6F